MTMLERRLASLRRRARGVLWIERLAPALAWPLLVLALPPVLALIGVTDVLPPVVSTILLIGTTLVAAGLAAAQVARLERPRPAEIDARLERASGEVHRPLLVLEDGPSAPGSEAVWQAHRDRAAVRVRSLRAGWPRLQRAAGAALVTWAAVLLLGVAGGPAVRLRLVRAMEPRLAPDAPARPVLAAWVVPPARTGLPPILLDAGKDAAQPVPLGSRITLSMQGGIRVPSLVYEGRRERFRQLDRTGFQADLALGGGGALEVWRHSRRIARYVLAARADGPPSIGFTGAEQPRKERAVLQWAASDDYGLARIGATMRLAAEPGGAKLDFVLTQVGTPRQARGGTLPSLVASPWAGQMVTLRLFAVDTAGQRSESGEARFVLPTHRFADPLAQAVEDVRQALARGQKPEQAAGSLDALSEAAARLPAGQFLNLRAVAGLLAGQPGAAAEAEQRLWQLATAIDDGGTTPARARLAAARDALRRALAEAPSAERARDIARATDQLQAAVEQLMQALTAQAARQGLVASRKDDGRRIDPAQLRQMAHSLAEAAKAGRTEEAAAALDRLGALLDGLQAGPGEANRPAAAPSPEQQALGALMRDQSALGGHTERRLSDTEDPRTSQLPEHDPDEAASEPDPAGQRSRDADAEADLRRRLGELAQGMGEKTGQVPGGLARADGAMRKAVEALKRGDDKAAGQAQGEAMAGLQQGAQQARGEQAGGGQARPGQSGGTDPLGRPLMTGRQGNGADDADGSVTGDRARGRALRDELRRRAADRTRSPAELEYIERLLQAR